MPILMTVLTNQRPAWALGLISKGELNKRDSEGEIRVAKLGIANHLETILWPTIKMNVHKMTLYLVHSGITQKYISTLHVWTFFKSLNHGISNLMH